VKYYEIRTIRISDDDILIVRDIEKFRKFLSKRIGRKCKIDISYKTIGDEELQKKIS
jgi:hypothetical protein